MRTPFFTVALAIFRKDLRAEFRSRELISTMLLFALLSILIFSFALELDRLAREEAVAGVLWVTVIFASVLGLNRSMALEREQGSMDALLLAPLDPGAIFLGKFAGNLLFSLTVGLLLLPLMSLLFNMNLLQGWMLLTLILGTVGLSSTGTLLAAMTVQTRSRESLLPIALMPVVLPVMLAAVRASTGILTGSPQADWIGWPQIILIVDLIYLVLCFLTFGFIVEE